MARILSVRSGEQLVYASLGKEVQVVFNLPFENVDCFQYTDPTVVPAQTFLSQLA